MRSVTITLAEREYVIRQLPMKANAAWRRHVTTAARSVLRSLPELVKTLAPMLRASGGQFSVESLLSDELLAQVGTVGALGDTAIGNVEEALDQALKLLIAYSPELQADAQRIEAEAYEDEVIAAFVAVVKLCLPFGSKGGELFRTLSFLGSQTQQTGQSSPSQSGAEMKAT
ncbi:MAG TPA: hypothetical protein PLG21_16940 [Anaerolineae bacterium]|nr:hypothetical protein [Anaerolineae bacterium]